MIEREEDRMDMYRAAEARIEKRSAPVATPDRAAPTRERETSGEFRSSEPVYGKEGLERDAGYKPLKEERSEPEGLTVRDAATDRAKDMQERPIEVHESGLKENITLSMEQAAKRVAEARKADVDQAELDGTAAAQKAVDKLRDETPAEVRQPAQVETDDAIIERALKNPKVQSAITEKITAAETQRAEYELGLQNTWKAQLAAIAADLPELDKLHHTQWAAAINAMAQREPARAKIAHDRLHALAKVEAAAIQLKAQKSAREQNEFKTYSAKENARFVELTKGMAPKEMEAVRAEVPAMMAEYGVTDPRAFLKAIEGQTTFPRGSAERIMVDAAKYRLMQKAAKAQPARAPLPPVQRPGVAQPRGNSQSANLQALSQKLSQTGDIKDAARLRAAQVRGQKR